MRKGPLSGVRIVDLTSVVVGPLCTQILADHGASVIKVETKSGDLSRVMSGKSVTPKMGPKFLHLNRNKRSIVLDLKHPAGHAALLALVANADVFVWNVRPSAMERLKLTYDDLRRVNPSIICCGMYGMGQGGRYRHKPAYDTIIQGASGLASLPQRAGGAPQYVPMVVADKVVGLIAVQMICMALYQRATTGIGCSVELPMFENMVKFVLEDHMYLKTFEPPLGGTGDPRILDPLSCPNRTSDGWICISANTDAQAFALFDAIGRGELKDDVRFSSIPARYANVGAYFQIRADAMVGRTTAEWLQICEDVDVPAMPYHTLDSVLDDPHLADVGLFQLRDHPTEGRIRSVGLANKWSTFDKTAWSPPPKLGEHSVEVLMEAGLDASQIGELLHAGVTVDGRP